MQHHRCGWHSPTTKIEVKSYTNCSLGIKAFHFLALSGSRIFLKGLILTDLPEKFCETVSLNLLN